MVKVSSIWRSHLPIASSAEYPFDRSMPLMSSCCLVLPCGFDCTTSIRTFISSITETACLQIHPRQMVMSCYRKQLGVLCWESLSHLPPYLAVTFLEFMARTFLNKLHNAFAVWAFFESTWAPMQCQLGIKFSQLIHLPPLRPQRRAPPHFFQN
jgi:hypothetical protein